MHKIGDVTVDWKTILGFGPPKAAGKSTFELTAPQPIMLMNYDGGNPGIPPGVGGDIWIQNYPPPDVDVSASKTSWARSRVVGQSMIQDLITIRNAMMKGDTEIELPDYFQGTTVKVPRPKTLILDGLVAFNTALMDWLMAGENCNDPEDYVTDKGKADTFRFWGKRLDRFNTILRWILPLPCNKALVTWEADEIVGSGPTAKPTGFKIPDIGGKLDTWGAGKVDASLYHYHAGGKFYVSTRPNQIVKCVGVRGRYDLPAAVDVTIDTVNMNENNPKHPKYRSPWERVWGKVVSSEKSLK